MKVAILGYDIDGASSTGYFHKLGAQITICDQKTDLLLPDYATPKLGEDYLDNLDEFDVLVRTPGLYPQKIVDANPQSPKILDKVTTSINIFFEKCPAPIIGVTGTKGKGTACTLIYKILQEAGVKSFLGGNIGTNPLGFLHEVTNDSWVVLELSNFQLIDFKYSPKIGVCLMLAPEHQDWHQTVKEYYSAKKNLFLKQDEEDRAIFNFDNLYSKDAVSPSHGSQVPYTVPPAGKDPATKEGSYVLNDKIYYQKTYVCDTKDVALLGRHNLENVCAAVAASWKVINGNVEAIKKAVRGFSGMEHRLEFVRELDGVKYYNDSFATTPEATIAAIRAFTEPIVIILGGHDKNIPLFDVVDEVSRANIRRAVVIGDTGEQIIKLLVERGFENISLGGNNIQEIVATAKQVAQPGDVVLLSTACASFGLFKNYKDRGNQFKQAVNDL
jgi:UDP-N-acetylmuramoylalanine--D-glutamate ligase